MLHNSTALRKFASEQKEKMNKIFFLAPVSQNKRNREIFCFLILNADSSGFTICRGGNPNLQNFAMFSGCFRKNFVVFVMLLSGSEGCAPLRAWRRRAWAWKVLAVFAGFLPSFCRVFERRSPRLNAPCCNKRKVGVETPTYGDFSFLRIERHRLHTSCRVSRFARVGTPVPTMISKFCRYARFFLSWNSRQRVSKFERNIRNKRLRSLTVN